MAAHQEPLIQLSGPAGVIRYGHIDVYKFGQWDLTGTQRSNNPSFEIVCQRAQTLNEVYTGRDKYTVVCNLSTNAWMWDDCIVENGGGGQLFIRGNGRPLTGQPRV